MDPTKIRRMLALAEDQGRRGQFETRENPPPPGEACQGVDVLPACRLQPKQKKNGVVFCMAPNYTRCEIKAKKKLFKKQMVGKWTWSSTRRLVSVSTYSGPRAGKDGWAFHCRNQNDHFYGRCGRRQQGEGGEEGAMTGRGVMID